MNRQVHTFERLPQVSVPRGAANDPALSAVRTQPLVGLIRNSRSHLNDGARHDPPQANSAIVATPQQRNELPAILADFAARRVDCIAIAGGDGTMRDVLTAGEGIFGDEWPPIIVLPSGKTNALSIDLGIPRGWELQEALVALRERRFATRRPLVVSQRDDPSAQVRGFILGGGVFTRCIELGQMSHRLGAFNAAVVGLTAIWSVAQALFGGAGNAWRQGTRMAVRHADGTEAPHRGGLPADERYLLFASTLERLPAGLNPFRNVEGALRMAVLDNSTRSFLLRIGSVLRGTTSAKTRMMGANLLGGDAFELEIGENFILDGEAFPAGSYHLSAGAPLRFVVP